MSVYRCVSSWSNALRSPRDQRSNRTVRAGSADIESTIRALGFFSSLVRNGPILQFGGLEAELEDSPAHGGNVAPRNQRLAIGALARGRNGCPLSKLDWGQVGDYDKSEAEAVDAPPDAQVVRRRTRPRE